ncbi:RES domain-containing protein [Virgibacillus halodenitrificans]|uniref:HEPN-associated N-terminal domain-containing protein n=1 Tax=Virgibacillus halodenitrificans TaxID=1482 RepID=UPI001F1D12E8|nr:HEPN-associated N-terminal domain-containing protein [Virgibacillus halodenitrificans]MCG1027611.1 RES domain-containing protein [Virgibacillus halodenitrificans]MCJ0931521.1 HEPN-associated N-terminal domain-containing protein [Virgibacillus halodenitrificans]
MGIHDIYLDRQREYGFTTFGNKNVCGECIDEHYIQKFIEEKAYSSFCDYCGNEDEDGSFIAADIDEVMEFIIDHLKYEWGHPDNEGVGFDSREGGYLGVSVYDGWDFAGDILCHEAEIVNSSLIEDIRDNLADTMWCEVDPYALSQGEELFFTWKSFSNQVKYETRYVFSDSSGIQNTEGSLEPFEIIKFIGSWVEDIGLIDELPSQKIYRARVSSKGEVFKSPREIGTPPRDYALNSNRMSPAGIPMFYGAIDINTALLEVNYQAGEGSVASIGEFINSSSLTVLDLTSFPKMPSIFDEKEREKRYVINFFYNFLDDFTKPISKDGKEHIDYVPTQIVTEYFRRIFSTKDDRKLDGIVYRSSKNGEKSFVLFFENEDFGDSSSSSEMILNNVSFLPS